MSLTLRVLSGALTIIRLAPDTPIPAWLPLAAAPLTSVTVTDRELSIICPSETVPEDVSGESGWIALRIEDKLEFNAIGILASLLNPLAAAQINILSISTFETDYVLVPAAKLEQALTALRPQFQIL